MTKISWSQFRQEVEEIYSLRAKGTSGKMRQVLREITELGLETPDDLRPVTIARWLKAHPERSRGTNSSLLRSLKSAVTIGLASGYLERSPLTVRFDLGPPAEFKARHYSITEIDAMLTCAVEEARFEAWHARRRLALVSTYAFAALRKKEALYLQWEDVAFEQGMLSIHPIKAIRHRLKTPQSAALVPMAPQLGEVLERWKLRSQSTWCFPNVSRTGPWTGGCPGFKPLCDIKLLGERSGVQGVTILGFRHSFATHARRWGISAEMVRAILRHTTLKTQDWYLHADLDDLADAARKVSYRLPAA
jgi:integrase